MSDGRIENVIELTLDGQTITVDVDADTAIVDLDEDMGSIASLLGWYGVLLGQAKANLIEVDGKYRAWRARRAEDVLARDPKLAEWKAKNKIESDRDFLRHKRRIANATKLVTRLEKAWAALERKSHILQSRGAMAREELRSTGQHTRDDTPTDDPDIADRKAGVREKMRKRRRRRPAGGSEHDDQE